MEEEIGDTLERKKKTRQEARKILELFIANSLKSDSSFTPSGRYRQLPATFDLYATSEQEQNITVVRNSPGVISLWIYLPLVFNCASFQDHIDGSPTKAEGRSDDSSYSQQSIFYSASSRPLSPTIYEGNGHLVIGKGQSDERYLRNRDSYYHALNDDNTEYDDCMSQV